MACTLGSQLKNVSLFAKNVQETKNGKLLFIYFRSVFCFRY